MARKKKILKDNEGETQKAFVNKKPLNSFAEMLRKRNEERKKRKHGKANSGPDQDD